MPKFRIGYSVSWVSNSRVTDIIEADDLEEAQMIARDTATEQLDHWAEPLDEEAESHD